MGFVETLLAVAGGIGIIGGAGAFIWKLVLPAIRLTQRVAELERRSQKDYDRLDKVDAFNKAVCKGLMAMLNNASDGNHKGEIKAAIAELQQFLIER